MTTRRTRRAAAPTARDSRPVRQPPEDPPPVLAARLYELHRESGKDRPYLERWPGDAELYGVLQFAQTYADQLQGEAFRQAAVLRVLLAEWLRLAADPFQLAAVDDARTGGTPWAELAGVLRYVGKGGEANPGSAVNLRQRLHVAVHGSPGDRRQPQVARLVELRAAQERAAKLRFVAAGEARYPELDAVARALLKHYEAGELPVDPEDDGYWWGELADAVDDRRSASERANLLVFVRAVAREVQAYARISGRTAATSEAELVLEEAAKLGEINGG
ncbi:hypothetical protein [Streptomyces parvus]|uniref:hypothetical protein n=1 Tax=Streptomyces parvus TaxID=66428 RepID=UPI0035E07F2C